MKATFFVINVSFYHVEVTALYIKRYRNKKFTESANVSNCEVFTENQDVSV